MSRITYPYALLSDIHLHNWSMLSKIVEGGLNDRLWTTLKEIQRAADELKARGGNVLRFAGDMFHVRGSVTPSVLNPTLAVFKRLLEDGFWIELIPGNHDLEGKDTDALGNACGALARIGCAVMDDAFHIDGRGNVAWVPWRPTVAAAQHSIDEIVRRITEAGRSVAEFDLIMHAPLNGVVMGIPDHGFSPGDLAEAGFKRVFCGHYHNHKVFEAAWDQKVISIGATTHQTWGDVGAKAGFLIVNEKTVDWRCTQAPMFIELTPEMVAEGADLPLIVDGHYVKARVETDSVKEVNDLRDLLTSYGARGVIIDVIRTPKGLAREGSSVGKSTSVQESVVQFIKEKEYAEVDGLTEACLHILAEAGEAA